jgi:hypothetical protein
VKRAKGRSEFLETTLTHELLNRLSIIVGNCDLVSEKTPEGSENRKLLSHIRENAKMIALELRHHQSGLNVKYRPTGK